MENSKACLKAHLKEYKKVLDRIERLQTKIDYEENPKKLEKLEDILDFWNEQAYEYECLIQECKAELREM